MKIIDDELYKELEILLSKRNKKLLNRLQDSREYEDSIIRARRVKSEKIRARIRESIKKLSQEYKKQPTRYQIHQDTKIAYITLKKYYDEIIKEFWDNFENW